ncbi:MAG: hypothetical protein J6C15_00820 [Bacteroidaceae bacterium]|nr:hypothetical protein [Bacteroidaceae bacterium]
MLSTLEILKQVWQKFGKGPKFHLVMTMEIAVMAMISVILPILSVFIFHGELLMPIDTPIGFQVVMFICPIAMAVGFFYQLTIGAFKIKNILIEVLKKDHPKLRLSELESLSEDMMLDHTQRFLYPYSALAALFVVVMVLEMVLFAVVTNFCNMDILLFFGVSFFLATINLYIFLRAYNTLILVFYEDLKADMESEEE